MVHSFLRLTGEMARVMCWVDCDKAFFDNSLNYAKNIGLRVEFTTARLARSASGEHFDRRSNHHKVKQFYDILIAHPHASVTGRGAQLAFCVGAMNINIARLGV